MSDFFDTFFDDFFGDFFVEGAESTITILLSPGYSTVWAV